MEPTKKKSPQPKLWWSDATSVLEEFLGWRFDKKQVARKTWKAYLLYTYPGLVVLLNAATGQPIQQDQVRKPQPEEHLTSQDQHASARPMRTVTVATMTSNAPVLMSGNDFIFTFIRPLHYGVFFVTGSDEGEDRPNV